MVKPFSPHSSIRAPAVRGPPGFLKTEPAHGWSNGVPALRHRSSRACNSLSLAGGSSMSASFASTTITLPRFEDRYLRSEEHTSELQSRLHLVCRLLLEKKKKIKKNNKNTQNPTQDATRSHVTRSHRLG